VVDQCRQQEPELRKIPQLALEMNGDTASIEHAIRCVRDI
jgi:hypothetical protein